MGLPGQDFLRQWEKYTGKIRDGRWLEQHALDPRNSDSVETKIRLDKDSRECIAYLQEMILMCNGLRRSNNLEML